MRTIAYLLAFGNVIASRDSECDDTATNSKTIPLGIFLPHGGKHSIPTESSHLPEYEGPIRLALRHIENRSCALNGNRLQLVYKSTECTPSLGMKALFDIIASDPRPSAVFGGLCTEVNEPIAMALKYWQIVQLSYAETHPKFSSADSKELYPTFYRIVPGDRNTNEAKCRLIQHFNWSIVGTIRQSDEPRYALAHEKLTAQLEHRWKKKVLYTAGITRHELDSIGTELDELKKRDVRIIIMDVDENLASLVACEAYQRGMYGDRYVWILPGYHKQRWSAYSSTNCTKAETDSMLDGHFAISFATERKDLETRLIGGKTAGHVIRELNQLCDHNSGCIKNVYQGFLYDGLWTLAIALAKSMNEEHVIIHENLLEMVNNSSFEGVTGHIRFENNERLGLVDVLQYRNGTFIDIGTFDGASKTFVINTTLLDGWIAPLDATIKEHRPEYISRTLFALFSLIATFGICLALFFLFVNIRYRAHRFIKMSSPNLNNIIIVGSMFTFASVILLGIDTRMVSAKHFVTICYARTWILCLGFTLAFGSMFSKTWRVHSIFTNIRMDKKAIKDSKLLLMLGMLLLIDFVVLSLWAFFSPFELFIQDLPAINAENREITPQLETCKSMHSMVFQAVLYVIKGILMILGCFLAWETRHVNIPALNDSKYIGMSVYNVVVMSVLGLSIAFILQESVNEAYALTCLFIIFTTTLTLCLVFVPKIIELARNPQGIEPRGYRRGLMKSVITKANNATLTARPINSDKDMLARAESENQLKHHYLRQKEAQLWELIKKLKELNDTHILQQDWCFVSVSARTPECDPLLSSDQRNHRQNNNNDSAREDWPWSDGEQPSTML